MIGLIGLLVACYYFPGPWRSVSVWILFLIATAGFQLMPFHWMVLPDAGISKPYDWMLVFAALVFCFHPRYLMIMSVWRQFRPFALFGLLLLTLFLYSVIFRDIEFSVALRVCRNYIAFFLLFVFVALDAPDLRRVLRGIIYATSLASLVYCLQPFLQTALLNRITSAAGESGGGGAFRYYNVPVFVYPAVFFLFYPGKAFAIRCRNLLLCINLLAILLTQHRNLIIAIVACFLLYQFFQHRIQFRQTVIYLLLCTVVFLIMDSFLSKRLSKGIDNIASMSLNTSAVKFSEVSLSDLSTTQFRQLMLAERFRFIMASETTATLGIGLMTDDSKKATPLQFYIGLADDDGKVSQIATGDIAWAFLLLQLGLPGTLLFAWLHFFLLKRFYRKRKDPWMQVGCLYLVALMITSFYSSMITMPYTAALLMLFAAYYYRLSLYN